MIFFIKKISNFLQKKLKNCVSYIYTLLFIVYIYNKYGKYTLKQNVNNAVLFYYPYVVLKFSLNNKYNVNKEAHNYNKLILNYPNAKNYFPSIKFRKVLIFEYSISERLKKINSIQRKYYFNLLYSKLIDFKQKQNVKLNINSYIELKTGLQLITDHYNLNYTKYLNIFNDIIKQFETGLCHGDLHSDNFMIDNNNHVKFIDLDCLRLNGIKELDLIYFIVEEEVKNAKSDWITVLDNFISDNSFTLNKNLFDDFKLNYTDDLLYIFLFDRIGQDFLNYKILYNSENLNNIIKNMIKKYS